MPEDLFEGVLFFAQGEDSESVGDSKSKERGPDIFRSRCFKEPSCRVQLNNLGNRSNTL